MSRAVLSMKHGDFLNFSFVSLSSHSSFVECSYHCVHCCGSDCCRRSPGAGFGKGAESESKRQRSASIDYLYFFHSFNNCHFRNKIDATSAKPGHSLEIENLFC